jgi:hypothetical protein
MRHPAPLYKLARVHISGIGSPLFCYQYLDFRPHNAVLSAFSARSIFDWGECFLSLLNTGSPPQIGVDVSCHCFTQVRHLNLTRKAWLLTDLIMDVSCPCFTQVPHLDLTREAQLLTGGFFLSLLYTGLPSQIGVDVSCPCFTQVHHLNLMRKVWLLTDYCYQLDRI